MTDKILKFMSREQYRPATISDFVKILKTNNNEVTINIEKLLSQKKIKQLNNGKYVLNGFSQVEDVVDTKTVLTGTISIIKSGAGFVKVLNDEGADYFVEKRNINGALHGDKVKISPLIKRQERELREAKVIEIIEHAKDYFVGTIVEKNGKLDFVCDDLKMNLPIVLESFHNLVVGNKVLVKIQKFEIDKAYGGVSRVIGHINDPGVDILSVVLDNGVKPEFDEKTIDYVNKIDFVITEHDRKIRKDLTNLNIITIDPWDAKDLDDAIMVKQLENGNFFLSVSIADVSWFVKYNTPLDKEALIRGTSVYLTDRVIPMLPHKLSNDICSLNQGVERFCVTCDMEVDAKGHYSNYKVYPSIIKSKRRFAYDEVNDFFNKKSILPNDKQEIKDDLITARKLHKILRTNREQQGYVDFDIKEPKIIVNAKGEAIDVKIRERGEAQMMIEDFMIAANEVVTIYMEEKHKPIIYRTHDKPDSKKIATLANVANKLGFKITGDLEHVKPKQVAGWLLHEKKNPNYSLVAKLMLRSMAKAKYSTKNIGHFGLASTHYTHFTSPIRRYPDLIVHRLYWANLFDNNFLNKHESANFKNDLAVICETSSFNEVVAVNTERDVNSMKFAEYMLQHIGNEYDGMVSSIVPYGAYIELPNTIEGLIPLKNLTNDFYVYDEKNMTLTGRNTRTVVSLGKKVRIKVVSANKAEKKIEFSLVKFI